jgi:hypothetical protein
MRRVARVEGDDLDLRLGGRIAEERMRAGEAGVGHGIRSARAAREGEQGEEGGGAREEGGRAGEAAPGEERRRAQKVRRRAHPERMQAYHERSAMPAGVGTVLVGCTL